MSYLFVVIIGAISGWIAGQYVKGSEMGIFPDVAAGAAGGGILVLFIRFVGPEIASGFVVSAIVAIIGGIAALYAMRQVLKESPAPVRGRRR
jgi:uncharacterized membrane protein YeaQ/YmgE (transglycosylase-associated protein family)